MKAILRLRVKRQLLFDSNQVLMQRKQRGVEVNAEETAMFQKFMTSLGVLDEVGASRFAFSAPCGLRVLTRCCVFQPLHRPC